MKRSILVIATLTLLLLPTLALGATLIVNGGFEGGYHSQSDIVGKAPDGWTVVNLTGNPTHNSTAATSGAWVEKIEGSDSHRIKAEKFDEVGGGLPFDTVLYQRITGLTPGVPYSVAGWFLSLWGGSARPENDSGVMAKRIGIDPAGGIDPEAQSVVWSAWDADDKDWRNLSVAARPTGSHATVFLQVWHKEAQPNTDAILDAVEFREAPTVTVSDLPQYTPGPSVTLTWTGALPDHLQELGPYALYYDVQRKDADGTWETVAADLTSEQTSIQAADGETVVLRVVPKSFQPEDADGHTWPPWTFYGLPSPSLTTTVDTSPPQVGVQVPLTPTEPFEVSWHGSDAASGVTGYDVQWRTGDEDWEPWFTDTEVLSATFGLGGEPAQVKRDKRYQIRVRAHDAVGHTSDWRTADWTYITPALLRGRVLDADGAPMIGPPTIEIDPYPFATSPPTPNRFGELVTGVVTEPMTIGVTASDGASLPPTYLTVSRTQEYEWRLPPTENAVVDGNFEGGGSAWGGTGWTLVEGGHTGHRAARLAPEGRLTQSVTAVSGSGLAFVWRGTGLGANATLHVSIGGEAFEVPVSNDGWTYFYRPLGTSGTRTLTLELMDTTTGSLYVDEVSLGKPRPAPTFIFLPVSVRQ